MYQKTTLPLHAAPSEVSSARQRALTLDEIQSDSITKIADKHFSGNKVKWDPKVVETIVEKELVPSNYSSHKLLLLEVSQYLEKVNLKKKTAMYPLFDSPVSLVPLAQLYRRVFFKPRCFNLFNC